jgi:phage FluMu gp28-like protein
MHSFGEDFGRTADITVIAPLTLEQDLRRTIPFLIELRNVPFREQELVLNFVVDRLPRFVYGALDATGNGQYMAERAWQRYGQRKIEQVTLNDRWYGENLPPLKASLEDAMTTIPRDADVLSDLLSLQVINGIPKLPKSRTSQKAVSSGRGKKRHGDAAIAIALADYASRQPVLAYAYESAKPKKRGPVGQPRTSVRFRSRAGGVL